MANAAELPVGSFHGHQRAFFVAASGPIFMALDSRFALGCRGHFGQRN
jgi:hypothetical protein